MPAQEEKKKEESTLKREEVKQEPEKEIFSWSAPSRPFKRMNREFWITALAMAAIVGLVLFFAEGFMPVILIVSIVFLVYVLTTVEPEKVKYMITNKGVKLGDKTFNWEVFIRFWFGKRFDSELLIVQKYGIPDRLELVINPEEKQKIEETLLKYLPKEKAPPSSLDKAAGWVSKKMPGV
jgi:hypothetical protein